MRCLTALALLFAWAASAEVLDYSAEWRLMPAGWVRLQWLPSEAKLHLETTGLVGAIYSVNDDYSVTFDEKFCASASLMVAHEGGKHREIKVTFHRVPGKAELVERDLQKDEVISTKEIDIPPCVHDMIAGLSRLRTMKMEPGESVQLPLSDGKRSVSARVEAQKRERVKTAAGTFDTIRFEAFVYNNVLFRRKARLFVWLTNDDRRLPVQIRVQMPFYIGTVTLQLEKEWYR